MNVRFHYASTPLAAWPENAKSEMRQAFRSRFHADCNPSQIITLITSHKLNASRHTHTHTRSHATLGSSTPAHPHGSTSIEGRARRSPGSPVTSQAQREHHELGPQPSNSPRGKNSGSSAWGSRRPATPTTCAAAQGYASAATEVKLRKARERAEQQNERGEIRISDAWYADSDSDLSTMWLASSDVGPFNNSTNSTFKT